MKHYYIKVSGGNQAIVLATDLDIAQKRAIKLFGSLRVDGVREATQKEIDWHTAFGGIIY